MNVYKYRSGDKSTLERDISSLENNYFWAPTRHDLNDPCEGLYKRDNLELQLDLIQKVFIRKKTNIKKSFDQVKIALENVLGFTDKSGVYSLSKTPTDELLWAHYSDSHKGFCIEYCIDKLIDFSKVENYKILVKYSSSPPQLNVSDISNMKIESVMQKILGTKSKKWQYEKEVRIVTSESGRHDYNFQAVKAIYFGIRMKEDVQDDIMQRLAGRGIKYYKIYFETNYKFRKTELKDRYSTNLKYMYSISPIADCAIFTEHVNENYRAFTDYLHKAAEIVRREPYCHLVESVDFSTEKGTPTKPVIYVQYKRSENRWVNHYLTIPDIEEQYSRITDLEKNKHNNTLPLGE